MQGDVLSSKVECNGSADEYSGDQESGKTVGNPRVSTLNVYRLSGNTLQNATGGS